MFALWMLHENTANNTIAITVANPVDFFIIAAFSFSNSFICYFKLINKINRQINKPTKGHENKWPNILVRTKVLPFVCHIVVLYRLFVNICTFSRTLSFFANKAVPNHNAKDIEQIFDFFLCVYVCKCFLVENKCFLYCIFSILQEQMWVKDFEFLNSKER